MELKEIIEQLKKWNWTGIYFWYNIWTEVSKDIILDAIKESGHSIKDINEAYDKFWEIIITFNDDTELSIDLHVPETPEYRQANTTEIIKD